MKPAPVQSKSSQPSQPAKIPGSTAAREPLLKTEIDEFGELQRRKDAFEADFPTKRYESLKAAIKAQGDDQPADEEFSVHGLLYVVKVSARENEATPQRKKIYRLLGTGLFVEIVTITQKAVKQALETVGKSEKFDECFSFARTGTRKLTVVATSPPAIEDAA
jgi:hypothetical protein